MGKSHLLDWLKAFPSYTYCTALQLINRPNPSTLLGEAHTLLIDALDNGDAANFLSTSLDLANYLIRAENCLSKQSKNFTRSTALPRQLPCEKAGNCPTKYNELLKLKST